MNISILGTESLGVRGLSCVVTTGAQRILIDPGIALGYMRHGLLPHPFQIARGEQIRKSIINQLHMATDIVLSHFHGDHIPLLRANPFQLGMPEVAGQLAKVTIHAPGEKELPGGMLQRRIDLEMTAGHEIPDASGLSQGPMRFSLPVFHGPHASRQGKVMMTRISDQGTTFVHASDIQLLDETAIDTILDWHPDIVLASGPPLYLHRLAPSVEQDAWSHAVHLANNVDTLILDHHLLRSDAGIVWLDRLRQTTGRHILCAAQFMHTEPCFLEAWREKLYAEMPVPEGWHTAYACGETDTSAYQKWQGWDLTSENTKP
jgi:hypothetical protein